MSKEHKTLCDWKKSEIIADWEELRFIVREPKYACQSCARSAAKKKYLCKPRHLKPAR